MKYILSLVLLVFVASCTTKKEEPTASAYTSWRIKGGTADGIQYSALQTINKENVSNLQVAWTYRTYDADTVNNRTQLQCNPIIVDGVFYATSAQLKAFAVNAATGKELWRFDPGEENAGLGVNRGVTYWEEGEDKRILYSFGENLYAINAKTGKKIESFGTGGKVSLKEGLGERAATLMVLSNTPGVIYKNLIIMGSRVHEGPIAAPGYLRAFDVKTGKLAWVFHTIPQPGEPGYETWPKDAYKTIGGVNAWSGMTVDHQRGLVYAGTGSPSFDFYGGNRKGQNLYANCVLALNAETGERKWHYQVIHHDMWDRDLPAPPMLVTVTHEGKKKDAVAQLTKSGFVYLLDRDSGEPLFPVVETPFPPSDLEGEEAWPTQPIPTKPAPFARQAFTEDMINKMTPEIESWVKEKFKGLRTGKNFIPPSKEGTVIFPGFDGGAEWGGGSYDPETGLLYVNANEMPWILQMVDVRMKENAWIGISLYRTHCATCHGIERAGDGHVFPSLLKANEKFNKESLKQFILKGKGVMPAFTHLTEKERDAIARYVLNLEERTEDEKKGIFERHPDILYSNTGYNRFITPEGYPAVEPPWGTLSAIDLNAGEIKWQVPLGEFKELKEKGVPPTGTENYGGTATTAGGLVFVAASRDEMFRAFDKATGKILWEYKLPSGGYATPSVYEVDGKQYVVIACGGGKMGTKSGDSFVAFALPK
ncbi:quinoprotein glucose dehydrogenase [Chryseolinea serpens]|uniref:Quinoprotein glucose dehydrogenase n=1 Tax=Chryseolinea serpens TaxID=947013 RepID=A0A1M5NFP3_9BACT|nr:PQQ-binding-like beta-propeller repeat protein [Chryseolinea serpens]SHG88267.1 quinoprotein glucose dehydrogenase [Chryseolinea serpens]